MISVKITGAINEAPYCKFWWSSLGRRGMDFYEAEPDRKFVDEFKKRLHLAFDLFGFLFPGI